MMRTIVQVALMLVTLTLAHDRLPTITAPAGIVYGNNKLSQNLSPYQAFEGIPYAQAPVGSLRFQPPVATEPWRGERDATKPGPECVQYLILYDDPDQRVKGQEDCLYLNVYTPYANNEKYLPVMFFIHGGSFLYGSGDEQGQPDYMMNKKIVLVTFNYRLGPLGFLSTEDSVVPGNMGLKDQVLALQWVSENIGSFGGDPKSVTLFGQSAGAASVHFHYLSPMSRGLFHRGISLSGSALNPWSQTESSRKKAKKLGSILGCSTNTTKELVLCLQTCSAEDIMGAVPKFMGWLYNPDVPFGPVVEKKADEPFIDRSPIDIIMSGDAADLPWITTVVADEGLYTAGQFVDDDKRLKKLNDHWETIAPHLLDYNFTIPVNEHAELARIIRQHYLGSLPIDRNSSKNIVQMMGDRLYNVDAEKSARVQADASSNSIRLYRFSYRGEYSLTDEFTGTKKNFGVSHADDEFYSFPGPSGLVTSEDDLQMSDYMVNLWASFATTGIPDAGIDWLPVDPAKDALQYLHIEGPNNYSIAYNHNFGDKNFWRTINFDENRPTGQPASDDLIIP